MKKAGGGAYVLHIGLMGSLCAERFAAYPIIEASWRIQLMASECQCQLLGGVFMLLLVKLQMLCCLEQCIVPQSWVRKPEGPNLPRPLSLRGQMW